MLRVGARLGILGAVFLAATGAEAAPRTPAPKVEPPKVEARPARTPATKPITSPRATAEARPRAAKPSARTTAREPEVTEHERVQARRVIGLQQQLVETGDEALLHTIGGYLAEHRDEIDGVTAFLSRHGVARARPVTPLGFDLTQAAAETVMMLRGQEPIPGSGSFPSPGLGEALSKWVWSKLTNTGGLRPSDPRYPWAVVSLHNFLRSGTINARSDAMDKKFWPIADEMTRDSLSDWLPPTRVGRGPIVPTGPAAVTRPVVAEPAEPVAAPAPAAAAPAYRTGYVSPWEALANPRFADYVVAKSRGERGGWLDFRDRGR